MNEFARKREDRIHGVLSCLDRMLFRGYLPIMSGWSMARLLQRIDLQARGPVAPEPGTRATYGSGRASRCYDDLVKVSDGAWPSETPLRALAIYPLPPGSRGLPFFGEVFSLLADPCAFVREGAERHGPVARSRLMSRDLVLLSGPQTVDAFLDESNVRRTGVMPPHAAALFGAGVVNQIDARAHRVRKQHLVRSLDHAALAHFLPQIRALLRARLAGWHAARGVSLQKETVLATLELVLATFVGRSATDADHARCGRGIADIAAALFGFPMALPGMALRRAQAFTKGLRERRRPGIAVNAA
jgi:hypothetical protein